MSQIRKFPTTPVATAIAAALVPIQGAQAQEAAAESSNVLEEVIVTATFRALSMQDLPQSIQAFTAADIERNQFVDFNDIANALPSMTLIEIMPGRSDIKFRGISTGTGEYYTDSAAAVYLDETPLTFGAAQLFPAMVDIERVESLPGPQGTLFGASSLAGTLRIISNAPDPTAYSNEIYGSWWDTEGGEGSWDVNGHVNIPLIADTLALRLVGYARQEGGWIDNVYAETYVQPDERFQAKGNNAHLVEKDWNDYTLTGGRAALRWNVNEKWSTTLTYLGEKGEADGIWAEDVGLEEGQIALFHPEFRDDEWWNGALLIEGDLGFAGFTSSTTYLDREMVYEWENMIYEQWKTRYYAVDYYGAFIENLYNVEYTYGWIFNDQTQDRVSQELRLTSQGDSRFQWMAGAFYEDVNDKWAYGAKNPDLMDTIAWEYANYLAYYYNAQGYDVVYPLPPTDIVYSQVFDRTVQQIAAFGEFSYEFTDKWSATAGARWFQFKRDTFDQLQFPQGLPPYGGLVGNGAFSSESTDDDMIFKLSTQYFLNDDSMVYALWSQGFRLGGENSQRAVEEDPNIPATYNPDTMDNYELGAKTQWLDNSLQVNLTLFRMEWEERQFSLGSVGGQWWLRGTVNGSDTETNGFELGLTWNALESLKLEANYTKLDAEISTFYEFPDGDVLSPGDPLPNSPENSYWAAADWTLPFKPFGGDLWTRISYAYGDETWDSTFSAVERDPDGLLPDWNRTDFSVGLALPSELTLTFFIENLTDERRVTDRDFNTESETFDSDKFQWDYVARPRQVGFSVRKRFE